MSIKHIEIKYYKSIDSCVLTLENVNLFIGENGTGKSNILDAVRYFFESLLTDKDDEGIYDINNKFSNEFSVSITFEFTVCRRFLAIMYITIVKLVTPIIMIGSADNVQMKLSLCEKLRASLFGGTKTASIGRI